MGKNVVTLLAGVLFGFGLGLSQMVDRGRVLGFLDLFGDWDPSLLFVLSGATGLTLITFRFILRRSQPLLATRFHLPTKQIIDRPLIMGAALFGIGWGIGGYCPGPAIAALSATQGAWEPFVFLIAMGVGFWLHSWKPSIRKSEQPYYSTESAI